jgi:predicted nuclease of predicted toxin-antitoxin system
MILADENIFRELIEALRQNGYEVFSIFEKHRGISDISISKLSLEPPLIILTEDKDFGNLIFEQRIEVTGVIFLRFLNTERDLIVSEVLNFLSTQTLDSLKGYFVTITPNNVRVKKIPDLRIK